MSSLITKIALNGLGAVVKVRGTQNLKGRLAAVLVTTELTGHSVVRCKAIRGYRAHVRTNSFPRAGVRLENG